MRRLLALPLLALLAALLLAACGDGGDDGDAGEEDSTATTEATDAGESTEPADTTDGTTVGSDLNPADGECPYVPTSALDEAFGSTFEVASASDTGCGFQDDTGLTLTVSRIDIGIDPETYADQATASCDEGTLIEVEAGDRAYACTAIGPFATYYEGTVAITFGAIGADDEEAVVEGLAAVLPSVSVP